MTEDLSQQPESHSVRRDNLDAVDGLGSRAVGITSSMIDGDGPLIGGEDDGDYLPTEEELKSGFALEKNKTAAFQLFDARHWSEAPAEGQEPFFKELGQAYSEEDRQKVGKSRELAKIIAGNPDEFAPFQNATVVVHENEQGEKFVAVTSIYEAGGEPFREITALGPNEKFDFGRTGKYENKVSVNVSGQHFSVWYDEKGKLFVQNHNPMNATTVSRVVEDDTWRRRYETSER